MILVTGASGHFGKAAIHALIAKGVEAARILALVRNDGAADDLKKIGVGIVVGDYDDYHSLVHACMGVEKLLFVSGNNLSKRLTQHQQVIQAAKQAGVHHLVYTSVQRRNETETSPLWIVAQSHIQTEIWLKESGMDYTILRNNLYMDFLPGFIGEHVLETGVIYVPSETGRVSAVLRSEMAEATAQILTTPGHQGKEYDFTNNEAVSYQEMAQIIATVSGKDIQFISPSVEDYRQTLTKFGLPNEVIGVFASFALAQAQGELDVESQDLNQLLGRKPVSVRNFIHDVYAPSI